MKYVKSLVAASCLLASIGIANAQSLGFISLSASVNVAGVTAFSSGVSATTHAGTGIYTVTFTRDITQCVIVVTPRGAAGGQASVLGQTSTKVRVYTFSNTGAAINTPFALVASCNS